MRCFISVDLENDVFDKIKEEFNIDGVKLVDKVHLTLKFFGEINEKEVEWIKEQLKRVKFSKFKIRLTKLGVFPNENRINVIWVGLEPQNNIKELQSKVEGVVKDKFPRDDRFQAHATIGRVKFVKDKALLKNKIRDVKVSQEEFEIKDFKLRQSILKKEGSEYVDLETYKAD